MLLPPLLLTQVLFLQALGCTALTAACRPACPTPNQPSQPGLPLLLTPVLLLQGQACPA